MSGNYSRNISNCICTCGEFLHYTCIGKKLRLLAAGYC